MKLDALVEKLRQSAIDAVEEESRLCPHDGTPLELDPVTGLMLCKHRVFHPG